MTQACLENNQCLFCDVALQGLNETDEHVFLSALGGRTATRKAICARCNNNFTTAETGHADDELAKYFQVPRNLLSIWSGRNKPPPTLKGAGVLEGGHLYDLAPGGVAIPQKVKPPYIPEGQNSAEFSLVVETPEQAARTFEILKLRGYALEQGRAQKIERQPAEAKLTMEAHLPSVCRAIAKLALVAACVAYGNQNVRTASNPLLRRLVSGDSPSISDFVAVDYVSTWPTLKLRPHHNSPAATQSGFEHSVSFADVDGEWVAFVELFGGFRFTVRLGAAAGLGARAMAINPRELKATRFDGEVTGLGVDGHLLSPADADRKAKAEEGIRTAMERVAKAWRVESAAEDAKAWQQDLLRRLEGIDASDVDATINSWLTRYLDVKVGQGWAEDLDLPFNEDA